MKMRLLGGQWTSNFRYNGEKIQVGLGVYGDDKDNPPNKAHIELGKIMADLEKGITPGGPRKKICKIRVKKQLTKRGQRILANHILPFFGEYRPQDLTTELIEKYLIHRWGRNDKGELQAVDNTWKKEKLVLAQTVRSVIEHFSIPKVKYVKLKTPMLQPLTTAQVHIASKFISKKYQPIYWIMAYTAMDISDVLDLRPDQIINGMIIRPRGKTGQTIKVPICQPLEKIIRNIPFPLIKSTPFFGDCSAKATSVYIRAAFKKAGLEGYGSKYLRRYVATLLGDAGITEEMIGRILAHADKSQMTKRYIGLYPDKVKDIFATIEQEVPLEKAQ